ncbi:uncharacterized protein LOC129625182 [Bubalus kerabau]|uniref:uncharacterized protein LOC129625182 n=1 Tax=Bubalus carabanensis TaxID=3119969 RepID=UPI00244E8D60|nr:uncharacterized protein LOC129625182 [Bubalus carabanensis]
MLCAFWYYRKRYRIFVRELSTRQHSVIAAANDKYNKHVFTGFTGANLQAAVPRPAARPGRGILPTTRPPLRRVALTALPQPPPPTPRPTVSVAGRGAGRRPSAPRLRSLRQPAAAPSNRKRLRSNRFQLLQTKPPDHLAGRGQKAAKRSLTSRPGPSGPMDGRALGAGPRDPDAVKKNSACGYRRRQENGFDP